MGVDDFYFLLTRPYINRNSNHSCTNFKTSTLLELKQTRVTLAKRDRPGFRRKLVSVPLQIN